MAAMVGKYAGKKILAGAFKENKGKPVAGDNDPLYARVPHPRKPGKFKKVKKQIPDYIPEEDAVILAKVRARAYTLDVKYGIGGYRFGISAVWGLIPVAGDIIDLLMALRILQLCKGVSCGLGSSTLYRMMFNIIIDYVVGIIPFIGDLADAAFKANTKNVRLLEERLDAVYKPKMSRSAKDAGREQGAFPATVLEDFSDDEDHEGDGHAPHRNNTKSQKRESSNSRQQSKRGRDDRRDRSGRTREPDVEMAEARPQR